VSRVIQTFEERDRAPRYDVVDWKGELHGETADQRRRRKAERNNIPSYIL
jgi:hypothetical protein